MIRNSFLSKFISACFLIFLFGININIAFCVEDTPTTNVVGETFIVSNIEYEITKAVETQELGTVRAVCFHENSVTLPRTLTSEVYGADYGYFVTSISPVFDSITVEHLHLDGFKEDSKNTAISSLDVQNMSKLKTVYVDRVGYVDAAKDKFPGVDVYKKPGVPTTESIKNLTCALEENNTIKLTWDKLDNADNYVITRTDKSSGEVIEVITRDCEYIDSGVEAGKTYDYAVAAFLGSGEKNDTFTVQVGSSETKELSIPNQESSDVNTNLGSSNAIISKPNHVTNNNNSLDSTKNEGGNLQDNNNLESNETDKNYSSNNTNTSKLNVYKTGEDDNHMVLFFCVMYFMGFTFFYVQSNIKEIKIIII